MSKHEEYKEALCKIHEIVTRKYVMSGRLTEIHDVLEGLNLHEVPLSSTESPSDSGIRITI